MQVRCSPSARHRNWSKSAAALRSRIASSAISPRRRASTCRKTRGQPAPAATEVEAGERPKRFKIGRLWAYARRETVELLRDPIRLAFALVGPIILMFAFRLRHFLRLRTGDCDIDQDDTPQSRDLLQGFDGSRYFSVQPPITSAGEAEEDGSEAGTPRSSSKCRLDWRDLLNNRTPEVDATVDGAMTFRGETSKNYVTGVIRKQGEELQRSLHRPGSANAWTDDDTFKPAFATIRPFSA